MKKLKNNKLINKIQSFYDSKMDYINKILNNKTNYKLSFDKIGKNLNIKIISNKKLILVGNYNFYGIYQPNTNLWIWASSIPGVKKEMIDHINKIKEMNYLFESDNDPIISFYYQLLTQDVLLVDSKQIKLINELLIYLSDDIAMFNPINKDSNIQFISLINIKEKYV